MRVSTAWRWIGWLAVLIAVNAVVFGVTRLPSDDDPVGTRVSAEDVASTTEPAEEEATSTSTSTSTTRPTTTVSDAPTTLTVEETTTEPPTTVAVTAAPVTRAPTTRPPATQAPTTAAPTTAAPTTAAPTTVLTVPPPVITLECPAWKTCP